MKHYLAAAMLLLALSACTPKMDPARMLPMSDLVQQLEPNPALEDRIIVREVAVNQDAEHNMVSSINAETFRETLTVGLISAKLAVRGGAPGEYALDARMVEFDTPGFGFSFDVPCTVEYTLVRLKDNATIYHDTIRQQGHAGFVDSFEGHERAVMAMSYAVRENVTHLIRVLDQLEVPGISKTKPAPRG